MLQFTVQGGQRFEELTRANVKRRIAIVVDDEVLTAPVVQEPIGGGSVRISMGAGSLDTQLQDAQRLEDQLNRGRGSTP